MPPVRPPLLTLACIALTLSCLTGCDSQYLNNAQPNPLLTFAAQLAEGTVTTSSKSPASAPPPLPSAISPPPSSRTLADISPVHPTPPINSPW